MWGVGNFCQYITDMNFISIFKQKEKLEINLLPIWSLWCKNAIIKKQIIWWETVLLLEFKTRKYAKNIVNNGSDLTLEKAQEIERLQEMSTTQANKMSHTSREVSKVNVIKKAQKLYNEKQTKRNHILVKTPAKPGDYHKPYTCTRCGYKHGDGKDSCPAVRKICGLCNEQNHFKKVCSKTKTNHCVCCRQRVLQWWRRRVLRWKYPDGITREHPRPRTMKWTETNFCKW